MALVALGGAAGSVCRYLVSAGMLRWLGAGFPFGTLAVNVVGSFLMGVLAGALADHFPLHKEQWRIMLGTGFLGGFTTFSAFALDGWMLLERGQIAAAGGYIAGSVLLSLAGLIAGVMLMRSLPL